jgi:hypothetical protein
MSMVYGEFGGWRRCFCHIAALRIRVNAFMSAISNSRFGIHRMDPIHSFDELLSLIFQMNTAGLSLF